MFCNTQLVTDAYSIYSEAQGDLEKASHFGLKKASYFDPHDFTGTEMST